MKAELEKILPPKRFLHSIGVAEEAVKLAKLYGADADKAYTAGLLHDCAKGYSIDEQIRMCNDLGVSLDAASLKCVAVIHAPLGAEIAKQKYGISDVEILDAIRYHTVGAANMTTLIKIIYLADMIEPSRDFEGVEHIRALSLKNLDEAVLAALEKSIEFNLKKKTIIHPDTLTAWNYMICERSK